MTQEFIPYEQALALKELGFDELCIATYDEDEYFEFLDFEQSYYTIPSKLIQAPLYQQAFRWFREKHNLHSYIEGAYPWFRYYVNSDDDRWEGFKYLTHEEAESACLDELIEIIKNK
jgi:hypothetical protein